MRNVIIIIIIVAILFSSFMYSKGYDLGWNKGFLLGQSMKICSVPNPYFVSKVENISLENINNLSGEFCENLFEENYTCYIKSVDFENNIINCACWQISD